MWNTVFLPRLKKLRNLHGVTEEIHERIADEQVEME